MEWKRRGMIAGITVGVFAAYRWLLPAALPFLAAWMFAAWLHPVAVKIEKKTKIRKTFVGTVLLAGIFGALGFLLYLGISEIFAQIKTVISNFPVLKKWCGIFLDNCCGTIEEITGIASADTRRYVLTQAKHLREQMTSVVGAQTLTGLFSTVKGILFTASGVVVTFITAVLLMGDLENLRRKVWDYSWLVGTRRVVRRLKKTTVTYLKAQTVIMLLVAAVCAFGFWAMKSPYFLIIGIVLGALDTLPLIGTGTFLYPAAVIYLFRGMTKSALWCVALDIVTSLLREFLEPRLLGGKLGVSPVAILISVYAGIFLYGGWGVVLGPLSFSTIYEIGKEWDVWD
ncbi:MAG: AI-2E family transporter [Eubacteriales bacterium]|nr:AI-2E family transporter [Eubacteriales bacterium]